ncbi:hypothetical protein K440DRAFT_21904 [Wilcoxina mikolae CBS 423.85]|nr:hypothetical protein K440DRAFT_21904 [Wilcoxina mikolae CBS 423.85]
MLRQVVARPYRQLHQNSLEPQDLLEYHPPHNTLSTFFFRSGWVTPNHRQSWCGDRRSRPAHASRCVPHHIIIHSRSVGPSFGFSTSCLGLSCWGLVRTSTGVVASAYSRSHHIFPFTARIHHLPCVLSTAQHSLRPHHTEALGLFRLSALLPTSTFCCQTTTIIITTTSTTTSSTTTLPKGALTPPPSSIPPSLVPPPSPNSSTLRFCAKFYSLTAHPPT